MARLLRKMPRDFAKLCPQSPSVISVPSGLNQPMSACPRIARPWNQRRRRKVGGGRRSPISARAYPCGGGWTCSQATQRVALSWPVRWLASPGRCVQVRAAGEARRELGERLVGAANEVADGVAILAVPLGPQRRKVAHLIATLADVPGLGDQLHAVHGRILMDQVEEPGQAIHGVELARQGGGEIKPKAVDVHLEDPVAQAVHDELQNV